MDVHNFFNTLARIISDRENAEVSITVKDKGAGEANVDERA